MLFRQYLSAVVTASILLLFGVGTAPVMAAENGGMGCAACTFVVGLMEQSAQINNRTLTQQADFMCQWLPSLLTGICQDLFNVVGPILFPVVEDTGSADIACNFMDLCKNETAVCRLFPMPQSVKTEEEYLSLIAAKKAMAEHREISKVDITSIVCNKSPKLCAFFHHFLGIAAMRSLEHRNVGVPAPSLPKFDLDKDKFSTNPTLRGYDWRGEDCDDLDAAVFPGRQSSDALGDANCNGISGIDSSTGTTYEEEWCFNTGSMGIALLGDSATAHFRIPREYMTAADWNSSTFNYLIPLLENEGDWPMLSWGTGFINASTIPVGNIQGPMQSLYSYLREHNLCNHNDFQNIGVNGADSGNLVEWATFLNRNGSDTVNPVKPLMIFFSMIGNDVCGSEQNFAHMTTPEAYLENIVNAIVTVDAMLPNGSMIILVPLIDGRILFDAMADRIHPLGMTNQDVTYRDVYNYLNCLDSSPCWGWMNSNETVRNTTWEIASSLNAQLPVAINMTKDRVKNVRVYYPGEVMSSAIAGTSIPKWELIEPIDGFHPSQRGNALIATAYWETLLQMGILPPVNPNNAKIAEKFGGNA